MKKEEVPQDPSSLSENNITEVCYAIDENGHYVKVPSQGWTPKTIVQNETLQLLAARAEEALQNLQNDIASPIPYFMEIHKMDINILSDYTGIWRWRIKRHFKPAIFKKLSDKTLAKYADAFDMTPEALKNFKG